MMRTTQLGTALFGLLGLVLGTAAPASACDPDSYMTAADQVTTQGPLVLQVACNVFWFCPETAPALTVLDAEGREVPGRVVDYLVSGLSAFVRWRPDVALEEGAEYTVQSDEASVDLDSMSVTRVVAEAPVLDFDSVTFELLTSRRDEGEDYCCGDVDSCGDRPCFGALGSRTIGVATARATTPSTHAVRMYEKGSASDDVRWQTHEVSAVYEFDAPADELCVVFEVWDLARDTKRKLEHCFAEHIEGLGEFELAWDGLDRCRSAPPVKEADRCLTSDGSLGPAGLTGEDCATTDAMLAAWCDATGSTLEVCLTPPDGGSSEDAGTPDAGPRRTREPGKCSLAPGAPGAHLVAVALSLLLLGLGRRRLGTRR